jgi:hypothetical protein
MTPTGCDGPEIGAEVGPAVGRLFAILDEQDCEWHNRWLNSTSINE